MVEWKRFIKDGETFLIVAEVLNITHFYKILLLLSTTRSISMCFDSADGDDDWPIRGTVRV
jgi:hypothetical protein